MTDHERHAEYLLRLSKERGHLIAAEGHIDSALRSLDYVVDIIGAWKVTPKHDKIREALLSAHANVTDLKDESHADLHRAIREANAK